MLISTSDVSPIRSAYFSTQTCAIYLSAKDTFIRRLATRDSLTCPKRFHYKENEKRVSKHHIIKKKRYSFDRERSLPSCSDWSKLLARDLPSG